jgi:prepilin-type N-terminal cleavage/methylation domain-containing protein
MNKGFTLIEVMIYIALSGYLFILALQLFLSFSQSLQLFSMLDKKLQSFIAHDIYVKDIYNLSAGISFTDHEIIFSTRSYDCSWSFCKGLFIRRQGIFKRSVGQWSQVTKSIASKAHEGHFVVYKKGELIRAIECIAHNQKESIFCALRRGIHL